MALSLRIGIPMIGGAHWHGGTLYAINLAKALLCQEAPRPKIIAVIFPEQAPQIPENREFFGYCDEIALLGDFSKFQIQFPPQYKVQSFASLGNARSAIDFIYPTITDFQNELPNASWIPDFQHHHLPEFFATQELQARSQSFARVAQNARLLVLSSEDARNDFTRFYPDAKARTAVLHFHSYLEVPAGDPWKELEPLGITGKFLLCCNQFWTHKDHITLFKALGILCKQGQEISLVCTGAAQDYRNQNHYNDLLRLLHEQGLQDHVKLLGFIPRPQQIALIRCCAAMVQPSLFEGWSTVLEDARCLGVRMIASDLAVHLEQNLEGALYFPRRNPEALAKLLAENFSSFTQGPNWERERSAQVQQDLALRQYGKDLLAIAELGKSLFAPKFSETERGNIQVQETERFCLLVLDCSGSPEGFAKNLECIRQYTHSPYRICAFDYRLTADALRRLDPLAEVVVQVAVGVRVLNPAWLSMIVESFEHDPRIDMLAWVNNADTAKIVALDLSKPLDPIFACRVKPSVSPALRLQIFEPGFVSNIQGVF